MKKTRAQLEAERLALAVTLNTALAFVANDAVATTYQTLGQYRTALLKLLQDRL